jgi:crotonobetainyl-CoA:carnitine CoA-transferase CaiB-like acyl-CoA transferase
MSGNQRGHAKEHVSMLNGIRVLDLGSYITAPLAAMILGDLQADVIKIERPEGDPFRRSHGTDYGATFLAFNRNKKSVALDITGPEGQSALLQLVDEADVLVENFRPGFLSKHGLGADNLCARNPRLIFCSITGFGSKGPYRSRPAFDGVGQALSGIAGMIVDPEKPESFGPTLSDNITAMYACIGILAALTERSQTGKGRFVEVNMLEASMALIQDAFVNYTRHGIAGDRFARARRSQSYVCTCSDGRLLAVHMSTTEKFWSEVVRAIGDDSLANDERFATHQLRIKHYHELEGRLAAHIRMRTQAEWLQKFSQTDVPHAPVNSVADAMSDPQVRELGSFWEASHPVEGAVVGIECPILVDGRRPSPRRVAPPVLGEHTAETMAMLSKDVSLATSLPTGTHSKNDVG